jgi:hypothetical protein
MQDVFFKAYVYVTDRSSASAGSTEEDKIMYMYEILLGDLLLRHRNASELQCFMEENESLRKFVRGMPDKAARRALARLGREIALPSLVVAMIPKAEVKSMAIIDYLMLAVSRWIKSDYSADPKNLGYRSIRGVERHISVLYSLEKGVIVNRKTPLH